MRGTITPIRPSEMDPIMTDLATTEVDTRMVTGVKCRGTQRMIDRGRSDSTALVSMRDDFQIYWDSARNEIRYPIAIPSLSPYVTPMRLAIISSPSRAD